MSVDGSRKGDGKLGQECKLQFILVSLHKPVTPYKDDLVRYYYTPYLRVLSRLLKMSIPSLYS
jgi:hypothetical protein